MSIELARLELKRPNDLSAFEEALLGWGPSKPRKLGLFFRVPGEYEDGSREKAHAGVGQILQRYGLRAKAEMVTVVGCEGATTPCAFVFADLPDENPRGQLQCERTAARNGPRAWQPASGCGTRPGGLRP